MMPPDIPGFRLKIENGTENAAGHSGFSSKNRKRDRKSCFGRKAERNATKSDAVVNKKNLEF